MCASSLTKSHPGVSEHERLTILERTFFAKIERAKEGKPWSGHPPVGRQYNKETGEWTITEKGQNIAAILKRYVEGETLADLCREYKVPNSRGTVYRWVHRSQLAGTYHAKLKSDELETDESIPMPMIPELVPQALLDQVKERLQHNRKHNRFDVRKYYLSGFVWCGHCGAALSSQTLNGKNSYYRHGGSDRHNRPHECKFKGIRCEAVEAAALDYLYSFFCDLPAFTKAVRQALPSPTDRLELEEELADAKRNLLTVNNQIANIVDAVTNGADVSLLLDKQDMLKSKKESMVVRAAELTRELAQMPDREETEQRAMAMRICLMERYKARDWRQLPFDEVKQFLHFLFGDNTKNSDNGIHVDLVEGLWEIRFRGTVSFHHKIVDGRPISKAMEIAADTWNEAIRHRFEVELPSRAAAAGLTHDDLRPSAAYLTQKAIKGLARYSCGLTQGSIPFHELVRVVAATHRPPELKIGFRHPKATDCGLHFGGQ